MFPRVSFSESFELALVPDDGGVEQSAAQGSDPAFSEGVGQQCGGFEYSVVRVDVGLCLLMLEFGLVRVGARIE